jgi:ankyrin repeat protein
MYATYKSVSPSASPHVTGSVECVEILLEHGASIDAPSSSGTPLIWAISSEQQACAEFLLEKDADVHGSGHNGAGPCMLAVATGALTTMHGVHSEHLTMPCSQ